MSGKEIIVGNYNLKEIQWSGGDPFMSDEISIWIKDEALRKEVADKILKGETVYTKLKLAKDIKPVTKKTGEVITGLFNKGFLTIYKKDTF